MSKNIGKNIENKNTNEIRTNLENQETTTLLVNSLKEAEINIINHSNYVKRVERAKKATKTKMSRYHKFAPECSVVAQESNGPKAMSIKIPNGIKLKPFSLEIIQLKNKIALLINKINNKNLLHLFNQKIEMIEEYYSSYSNNENVVKSILTDLYNEMLKTNDIYSFLLNLSLVSIYYQYPINIGNDNNSDNDNNGGNNNNNDDKKKKRIRKSNVNFACYSDKEVKAGHINIIKFIVYNEKETEINEKQIKKLRRDKNEDLNPNNEIEYGKKYKVTLKCDVLKYTDIQYFDWNGKMRVLDFKLEVPIDFVSDEIVFEINVSDCDLNIMVARMYCKFLTKFNEALFRLSPLYSFFSYSHNDINIVSNIKDWIEEIKFFEGVFFDDDILKHNDNWKEEVIKYHEKCKLFYLCWSKSASKSEAVKFEYENMIKQNGLDTIKFIPLEKIGEEYGLFLPDALKDIIYDNNLVDSVHNWFDHSRKNI